MKQFLFKNDAQSILVKGINTVADAVGSTMGAMGKTVIINNGWGNKIIVTKDGITVAKHCVLGDPREATGAYLAIEASDMTLKLAGDGTTNTVVLLQSMVNEFEKILAENPNANRQEIKRSIENNVAKIVASLKTDAIQIDNNNKIKQIATISANNDEVIGQLIADAYLKIGNKGKLDIQESGTLETKIEISQGTEMDRGYISPVFVNNKEKMQVCYDNPLFLIAEYQITTMQQIAPILEKLQEAGELNRPIIIIAIDFDGEAYSSIVYNNSYSPQGVVVGAGNGIIKCCPLKAPITFREQALEDIAVLTGATVIRDSSGLKVESTELSHLGTAKKIIVDANTTTIIGGGGVQSEIDDLINSLDKQMGDMKDEQMKEAWSKRIAQMSNSMGIIKVGGATDTEVKEKKDRVDDSCRAVRSAIEEGAVIGGGITQLRYAMQITDTDFGSQIVKKALEYPLQKMAENAGLDYQEIHDKIILSQDANFGFNFKTGKYTNMSDDGIFDPAKVIRIALQNASSVACSIITSDCLMVEMPK